jgi:uncharacterized membrane protein HdeD (DUF308 family)
MGAFFLVAGLFQLITPFVISLPDWGWHTLNGLITLLLGILVLAQWPVSGLWVIGLFVGIEFSFTASLGLRWRSACARWLSQSIDTDSAKPRLREFCACSAPVRPA